MSGAPALAASAAGRQQPDIGFFHVAGILVHAAADRADALADRIAALPGAMIHARSLGKLVATLEGTCSAHVAAALNTIQGMPGVISAVLVSEHSEPLAALDEEISIGA